MPLQVEIADDLRTEKAVHVRGGRNLEAGPQLLGNARAAQNLPALQYQDLDSGTSEVGSGDQSVVAAADDDQIVCRCHVLPDLLLRELYLRPRVQVPSIVAER